MNANYWINKLNLIEHPEGGYFREVYRSTHSMSPDALPAGLSGEHDLATSIYFLITSAKPSHFHRLKSDELWYFHEGTPITIHTIDVEGEYRPLKLGRNIEAGEDFQHIVPSHTWFGATVEDAGGFGLVSCTVVPGFEFSDFELASRSELLREFPEHQQIIERLTSVE
ncbi:MAG: cupin domain-containing protein [Ignavibacteriae bacterium]|nr:cupin domain-containing protein [Ignavibacteriota bacterium]MCB9217564.1 cupin domain-containing protein [Ignavibacteria bacterium]